MNIKQFTELVKINGDFNSQVEAKVAITAVTASIAKVLSEGDKVSLDIGTFVATLQKGKSGVIPGTKKKYTSKDKMVPKFRASKSLKETTAGK